MFSKFKLTTSSGKHLECFSHAHIVSIVYKLFTSSRGSDDLSTGFDRHRGRSQQELTNNKNVKGKYHVRIMLKDVLGFAEHQEKTTYALGYKITLTGNEDDVVLDKTRGIADARIKIDHFPWYVPHYKPCIPQQRILPKHILSKTPTELRYFGRSVFMNKVKNQNLWNLELGSQET